MPTPPNNELRPSERDFVAINMETRKRDVEGMLLKQNFIPNTAIVSLDPIKYRLKLPKKKVIFLTLLNEPLLESPAIKLTEYAGFKEETIFELTNKQYNLNGPYRLEKFILERKWRRPRFGKKTKQHEEGAEPEAEPIIQILEEADADSLLSQNGHADFLAEVENIRDAVYDSSIVSPEDQNAVYKIWEQITGVRLGKKIRRFGSPAYPNEMTLEQMVGKVRERLITNPKVLAKVNALFEIAPRYKQTVDKYKTRGEKI